MGRAGCRQREVQTDRQTDEVSDLHQNWRTNRQTDTHTHTHTHTHIYVASSVQRLKYKINVQLYVADQSQAVFRGAVEKQKFLHESN